MTWMFLPMILMMSVHVLFLGRTLGRLSPPSLFIYMQFIMALGTLPMLDHRNEADFLHGWIILGTFTAFWATSGILALADSALIQTKSSAVKSRFGHWAPPRRLSIALLFLSVAICIAYYAAIGYNVLGVALMNAVEGGGNDDIASLRFQSYAGEKYFYPGYVNQFKNALLPALVCTIVPYMFIKRLGGRWILGTALTLASLTFILGTGQRGAFITFMITLVVFMSLMNRRELPRRMLLVFIAMLPIFFISTFALGRSSSALQRSSNLLDQVGVIGGEILFRILGSNQEAAVAGFRYIYSRNHVNGMEWWQSLVGLLPGVPGSTLSNEIFAQLYGSWRGTAPPSVWSSVYYNFGLLPTLIFSIVLAVVYHRVGRKIRLTESINSIQAIGMAGVTTVLGTWVAGSPDYFMNVGLVVYIFLWNWGTRLASRPPFPDFTPLDSLSSRSLAPSKSKLVRAQTGSPSEWA